VRFAKDALEKKDFGELIAISSRRVSNFPGRIRDVGCILDIGIHDIDVMRYLVGKVSSVYASGGKFKSPSFEDHANILLNFDNGVTGMIEVNWLTPMKVRKLFLTCSERFVELDYINQEAIISYSKWMGIDEANLYHVPIEYRMDRVSLEKKEPLMNEIEDFVDSIERDREPLVTGKDGFEALRIAKAAERSHEKGEVVQL
jgi:UDP-N-acetylglucosamine 3-dehydrogenase